jgi:hypothetical protein
MAAAEQAREETWRAAGLPVPVDGTSPSQIGLGATETQYCESCMEEHPASEMVSLWCGHGSCKVQRFSFQRLCFCLC